MTFLEHFKKIYKSLILVIDSGKCFEHERMARYQWVSSQKQQERKELNVNFLQDGPNAA